MPCHHTARRHPCQRFSLTMPYSPPKCHFISQLTLAMHISDCLTAMPCHVHYTCHTTRANPYHTTPMPSFMPSGVLCVTAGCHSTFPSAKPGERASEDIRVIIANQAIPCPFLLRLVLTLSFAFPSPPPPAPLCLPRTYAKKPVLFDAPQIPAGMHQFRRIPQESTGIHWNPLEWNRNPVEWNRNPVEWNWNPVE